jgi:hypothetical protein
MKPQNGLFFLLFITQQEEGNRQSEELFAWLTAMTMIGMRNVIPRPFTN